MIDLRKKELVFIFLTFITLSIGFSILSRFGIIYAALSIAPYFIISVILSFTASGSNQILLPAVCFLNGLGLLNLFQIEREFFIRQLQNLFIGTLLLVIAILIIKLTPNIFEYKYILGSAAILLFLLPVFIGITRGGARLWISIAGFTFQPSEFAKVLMFFFIAGYFAEHRKLLKKRPAYSFKTELLYMGPAILFTLFSLLLLIYVKDLGFSLLLVIIFLIGLYVATSRGKYVLITLGIFGLGAYGAYNIFGHVRERINSWINPWSDVYGASYQIVQSLFAVAEGGVLGRGLGQGFPDIIPAAHTDLVFPVWVESTGIPGGILILSLYLLITLIGLSISKKLNNPYSSLFVAIAMFTLFFQAMLVTSGTLLVLPLTGLTMPFFSYGGSSLVSSLATIGIILVLENREPRWIIK